MQPWLFNLGEVGTLAATSPVSGWMGLPAKNGLFPLSVATLGMGVAPKELHH